MSAYGSATGPEYLDEEDDYDACSACGDPDCLRRLRGRETMRGRMQNGAAPDPIRWGPPTSWWRQYLADAGRRKRGAETKRRWYHKRKLRLVIATERTT